jgi:hypothetical protein
VNNVDQYKNTHESRMTGKDSNFDIIHIDVLEWVLVFHSVCLYISENDNL